MWFGDFSGGCVTGSHSSGAILAGNGCHFCGFSGFSLILLSFTLVLFAWLLLPLNSMAPTSHHGLFQTPLSSPVETTVSLWLSRFPIKHLPQVHWSLIDAKASTWSVGEVSGRKILVLHHVIHLYKSWMFVI